MIDCPLQNMAQDEKAGTKMWSVLCPVQATIIIIIIIIIHSFAREEGLLRQNEEDVGSPH